MLTIFSLLVVAYVPGAVIFRLPIADRPKRAALPPEERFFWAVMISIAVSTTTAFLLAALGVYSLALLVACNIMLAIGLVLGSAGNLMLGASAGKPRWTLVLPLALVAGGVWMYFAVPAAEYVMGGRDPGVYVNEGIQIAQRQSLVTTDPMASAVPPATRDLFFPRHQEGTYYSVRFMGFHLRDPETGIVSGQFPQGYPVWIAIAYGLDGVTGTRRVTAWWAILGVLALYFAASRLIGPVPAAIAAGLLTIHVIQTWYARYPNSELVTQALLFAALLAHAYAHEDEDRFFGPVAASLLGIALFTRLPAVLVVGAAVVASFITYAGGHRARAGFVFTLVAWVAAAGIYYMTQLRPYFTRPLIYLQFLQPVHVLLLTAGAIAVGGLLWAVRTPSIAATTRKWLPPVLIATLLIGATYAYFFREPRALLAPHDAHALRMFVDLYFTRLAFGLALVGYALVVWRSFWRAPALILGITIASFFFFYKMRIWPEHFWLARRFVPAILPGAFLFAAAAVFAPLWILPREHRWRRTPALSIASGAIGVLAGTLLAWHYFGASRTIRTHIEYADLIPRIERLAARFADDDLVLVEAREASDVHVLALPLAYIYARNILVLDRSRPDKQALLKFLTWARERFKNIYFMAGGGTDLLSAGIGAKIVDSESFRVPEYNKTTYDVYPRSSLLKPFDFTIYRLIADSSDAAPQSLDIGGADDLHLVDFYPKERLAGGALTFRWTEDTSLLLMGIQPGNREVVLRMSAGRPRGVAPPSVVVSIDGRQLGTAEPAADFRDHAFPIPGDLASQLAARGASSEIRIQSSTWTPNAVLGGTDNRALGVMVDRAEIR
jgi:hypothetical protein